MTKYSAAILLPLTVKETGTNPIFYPLLVFEVDPNPEIGKTHWFKWVDGAITIDFRALVTNRSERMDEGTHVVTYLLELEDRQMGLQIAELVKKRNPGVFEENNNPG